MKDKAIERVSGVQEPPSLKNVGLPPGKEKMMRTPFLQISLGATPDGCGGGSASGGAWGSNANNRCSRLRCFANWLVTTYCMFFVDRDHTRLPTSQATMLLSLGQEVV